MNKTISISISCEELQEAFPDYSFPFNLNKAIKDLSKREGKKYIADELAALIKRDPELKSVTCLTTKAIKTCAVYKIRIKKDNNRGKSAGYRVVFLLITIFNKGYVLDITDHDKQDDLTNDQKQFCNQLVVDIDNEINENENNNE